MIHRSWSNSSISVTLFIKSRTTVCLFYVWVVVYVSVSVLWIPVTATFLTAFDDMNQQVYTACNNIVFRQSATLEQLDKIEFESTITMLELIHADMSVFIFCCVRTDHGPRCFLTNAKTRVTHKLRMSMDDLNAHNVLRYTNAREQTHVFSCGDQLSPNIRCLSVTQDVVRGTHHTNATAIAIYTIDLNSYTLALHKNEKSLSIVHVTSTVNLLILNQFYYKYNMFYIARYPKSSGVFRNVVINIDLVNGTILETDLSCLDRSNISHSVTTSSDVGPDDYLLTSHTYQHKTVICTIKITELEEYFKTIKSDKIKTVYNIKLFIKSEDGERQPSFNAVNTLYVSQSTSLLDIGGDTRSLAVTRAPDNTHLVHLCTDGSAIHTITMFRNSQVISAINVSVMLGQDSLHPESLVQYNNTLYVHTNNTLRYLDLTDCRRHGADNNDCLRDKTGCSFCPNTTENGTTFYCGTMMECGLPELPVVLPSVSSEAVQPTVGPACGGNILMVTGGELDMATNITVIIGGKLCTVFRDSVTSTSLQCVAPSCDQSSPMTMLIIIDGHEYNQTSVYHCVPDPIITETVPSYTIQSGGSHIILKGEHLNLTTDYVSLVFVEEDSRFSIQRFPCTPEETGDLSCVLPPISPHSNRTTLTMRLSLYPIGSLPVSPGLIDIQPFTVDVRHNPYLDLCYEQGKTGLINCTGDYFDNVQEWDIKMYVSPEFRPIKILTVTPTDIICSFDERRYVLVTFGDSLLYPKFVYPPDTPATTIQDVSSSTYVMSVISTTTVSSGVAMSYSLVPIIVPVTIVAMAITVVATLVAKKVVKKRRHRVPDHRHQRPSIVSYHGSIGVTFGERTASRSHSSASVSDGLLTECTDGTSKEILRHLEENSLIIKRANLRLDKMIGRGNFGSVYKGVVKNNEELMDVAVKTLHQDAPRDIDIQLFLKEAFIMKDFQHENVMTLVGICLDLDDMPLVILPFMEHGDLLSYLHEDARSPTIKDLVAFGLDIAKGMSYLAQLKCVHRDLAARNCMLDSNYVVKIADFGLSRDIYETSYYSAKSKGTKLPVKWMAIDSLTNGEFNEKTDVWSFGVTLWELMTRGVRPYGTVDNWDMERYLNSGRRLPQPLYCPNQLYKVMRKCWAENPDERPSFVELQSWISEMLDRVHHQLGSAEKITNIQTTYVNIPLGSSYHYENEIMFDKHDDVKKDTRNINTDQNR